MKEKAKYDVKNIFKVPEGYFEDLTNETMQKAGKERVSGKPGFFTLARPHLMMAASMLILVIISYATLRFILPDFRQVDKNNNLEELTEYLADEMDSSALIERIEQTESEFYIEEIASALSDEEIIEYLSAEEISYEDILENL